MTDCRECFHSVRIQGATQCVVLDTARPIEWMRDPHRICGPEAKLFEPKTMKYAEFDE